MSQYDSTLFKWKARGFKCLAFDTEVTHMTVKNENSSISAAARINLWFAV